jgi:hypothetical protein
VLGSLVLAALAAPAPSFLLGPVKALAPAPPMMRSIPYLDFLFRSPVSQPAAVLADMIPLLVEGQAVSSGVVS